MTYATLRGQIASRVQGLHNPSLAEKLGYESPLDTPWTSGNVGSQILSLRGNSHGTSPDHPRHPTKFALAAYTLLDPKPLPVGTMGPVGFSLYGTHSSKYVVANDTRAIALVTPYGFEVKSHAEVFGVPHASYNLLLGDDFLITARHTESPTGRVHEIGSRSLNELTILDEVPASEIYQVLHGGGADVSVLRGEYVCTVHNASGNGAAIYIQDVDLLWCYTTKDSTLGLVRMPDGTPLRLGKNTSAPYLMRSARGILDDDRFEDGRLNLTFARESSSAPHSMWTRIEGFRQILEVENRTTGPYSPASMTLLFYNDYHIVRTRGQKRGYLYDETNPDEKTAWTIPGDARDTPGPIDIKPVSSLQAFGDLCETVGVSWIKDGWAARYEVPSGGLRPYKYL